ncbi:MAG: hypothetical protein JNK65_09330 [Deltaproteobacteria bacterium]|nr:hypothetical protein [Deltaproteobacteria bacterium]
MSGNTGFIRGGHPVLTQALSGHELSPSSGSASSLTQITPENPGQLGVYLNHFNKLVQASSLSHRQRLEMFRHIAEKIITHPTHPYSKLDADLRQEMIGAIADVLADSPRDLPKKITRVA